MMHILEGVQAWRLPVIFWIWVFFVDFPLKHHRNVNIKKCDKSGCTPFRLHIDRGCIVGILHSPSKCLAWVKKCCHVWLDQNFDPSLLTNKLWLIFMGNNFKKNQKKNIFFCFIPMKTSQSSLVSKDGSKFWSSQTWWHFLTHAKHFEGECS